MAEGAAEVKAVAVMAAAKAVKGARVTVKGVTLVVVAMVAAERAAAAMAEVEKVGVRNSQPHHHPCPQRMCTQSCHWCRRM